jgi:hypothetical protein
MNACIYDYAGWSGGHTFSLRPPVTTDTGDHLFKLTTLHRIAAHEDLDDWVVQQVVQCRLLTVFADHGVSPLGGAVDYVIALSPYRRFTPL